MIVFFWLKKEKNTTHQTKMHIGQANLYSIRETSKVRINKRPQERKSRMDTIIEPVLDSFAGNIEIAIYMATEIEDALTDICQNTEQRVNLRLKQLQNGNKL